MHHLCSCGGKLPRNRIFAFSGKNGSNGCFSIGGFIIANLSKIPFKCGRRAKKCPIYSEKVPKTR